MRFFFFFSNHTSLLIESGPAVSKEADISKASTASQNGDNKVARKRKTPKVKTELTSSTEDSDDDIIPLSQVRANNRRSVVKAPIKEEDSSDDDDDIPLAKRKKVVKRTLKADNSSEGVSPLSKRTTVKKQTAKKEESSDDDTPLVSGVRGMAAKNSVLIVSFCYYPRQRGNKRRNKRM